MASRELLLAGELAAARRAARSLRSGPALLRAVSTASVIGARERRHVAPAVARSRANVNGLRSSNDSEGGICGHGWIAGCRTAQGEFGPSGCGRTRNCP